MKYIYAGSSFVPQELSRKKCSNINTLNRGGSEQTTPKFAAVIRWAPGDPEATLGKSVYVEMMPPAELFPVQADTRVKLAEHAEVIRTLGKRVVADVIEIGRRSPRRRRFASGANGYRGWNESSGGLR